jgi:hypothetical protein
MLRTLTKRTEKKEALGLNGNGGSTQSLGRTDSLYRVQAALASALARIDRELNESIGWLHEEICDCDQCMYELRRQRRLIEARAQLLAELSALGDVADNADDVEVECVRCCKPFVPVDDEQLCEQCWLAENGPPHR